MKLNFVGGEPLMHPNLQYFVEHAKNIGLTVSIVTNGLFLSKERLDDLKPFVDWIEISVDSANEYTEKELGRGFGKHVQKTLDICENIQKIGIKLKINTVVTKLNFREDLLPLIEKIEPHRWKIFQVLYIAGQNDSLDKSYVSTFTPESTRLVERYRHKHVICLIHTINLL